MPSGPTFLHNSNAHAPTSPNAHTGTQAVNTILFELRLDVVGAAALNPAVVSPRKKEEREYKTTIKQQARSCCAGSNRISSPRSLSLSLSFYNPVKHQTSPSDGCHTNSEAFSLFCTYVCVGWVFFWGGGACVLIGVLLLQHLYVTKQ